MTLSFTGRQFAQAVSAPVVSKRPALIAALLFATGLASAADRSLPVTGNLLGSVVDAEGIPQIGATIQIVNKYQRVIAQTLSGKDGRFALTSIPNDIYSVRASLPSFLPALKNRVLIQGGVDSILEIHLATLFSNIEVTYAIPSAGMTDDWKWVLRSSPNTRPINRYANVQLDPDGEAEPVPLFSQTHAMFSLSGGAGGFVDTGSSLADLGTGFAVSTNIYGNNQLQVSGTFGESPSTGAPQMALLATYSRKDDAALAHPPEVTLTMSQVGGIGSPLAVANSMGGTAPLRAMSLSVYNTADPLDGIHLEYGATGESVDLLQHTSRVSPFARVTVDAGKAGEIVAAFSDGSRPDILARHTREAEEADEDLGPVPQQSAIGRVPGISNRAGRLRLERTQNAELGLRKVVHSVTLAASAYYEDTADGRINVAGNLEGLSQGDLLSDSVSTTSYWNIGSYHRNGYLVSSSRKFGDTLEVALAYGRAGGFSIADSSLSNKSRPLRLDQRNLATVNVKAAVPVIGTRITAGYGWADAGSIVPYHSFTTQSAYVAPGLNIYFRQPLPGLFGAPGRLELTGSLQNLLAQGYLPIAQANGQQLLIVQAPRTIRGGLNFIF